MSAIKLSRTHFRTHPPLDSCFQLISALLKKYMTVSDPAPYDRYVLITSDDGYCATYSFGELFNSRMGDQIVIAAIKDGKPLSPTDGFAMSVTGEDSTGGRSVKRIKKIEVR